MPHCVARLMKGMFQMSSRRPDFSAPHAANAMKSSGCSHALLANRKILADRKSHDSSHEMSVCQLIMSASWPFYGRQLFGNRSLILELLAQVKESIDASEQKKTTIKNISDTHSVFMICGFGKLCRNQKHLGNITPSSFLKKHRNTAPSCCS